MKQNISLVDPSAIRYGVRMYHVFRVRKHNRTNRKVFNDKV